MSMKKVTPSSEADIARMTNLKLKLADSQSECNDLRKENNLVQKKLEEQNKLLEEYRSRMEDMRQKLCFLENEMRDIKANNILEAAKTREEEWPVAGQTKRRYEQTSPDTNKPKKMSMARGQSDLDENSPTENGEKTYANAAADKIPPITIQGNEDWTLVRKKMKELNIGYDKARIVRDATKIFPKTPGDFRNLTTYLEETQRAYYTYTLPSDRKFHGVLRGLPVGAEVEEIERELAGLGYKEVTAARMTNMKTKKPMPLFLIKTTSKEIFNLDRFMDLVVTVEAKKRSNAPSQCFRCQKYGHKQRYCTFPHKCVKCAKNHPTNECKLEGTRETKNATCANCGKDGHPASYRGCEAYPKRIPNPRPLQMTQKTPNQPSAAVAAKTLPPPSAGGSLMDQIKAMVDEMVKKQLTEYLQTALR